MLSWPTLPDLEFKSSIHHCFGLIRITVVEINLNCPAVFVQITDFVIWFLPMIHQNFV